MTVREWQNASTSFIFLLTSVNSSANETLDVYGWLPVLSPSPTMSTCYHNDGSLTSWPVCLYIWVCDLSCASICEHVWGELARVLGARLHAFTNEVLLVPSCFFIVLHLGKSQNKLCWSHSKMNARQSLLNPPSCTCKTDRWRSQKWVLPTWWCRIVRIALNPMIPFLWLKLDRQLL